MKDIVMHAVRKAALEFAGVAYRKENYYKLPARFFVDRAFLHDGLMFRVLSSEAAKHWSRTKAERPHRILVWDCKCNRWQFAGKYAQHCRMVHKEDAR